MNVDAKHGEKTVKYTAQQVKRILEAIGDCDQFIAKEGPRNPDLRPADMQQHLDFCIAHKQKLIDMLAQ